MLDKMLGHAKDEMRLELKQCYYCEVTKNNKNGTVQAKSLMCETKFDDVDAYNGEIEEGEKILILQVGQYDYVGILLKPATWEG